MMSAPSHGFTMGRVGWIPRVAPIDEASASSYQLEVLEEQRKGKISPLPGVLAHAPEIYSARGRVAHTSLEATDHPDALPLSDRQFAAAVESRSNGCLFSVSVHANSAIARGADAAIVTSVVIEGPQVVSERRYAAIAAFTLALSECPPRPSTLHVDALRDAGLTEGEIFDLVLSVSQFAWANRTTLPLGDSSPPNDPD